MSKKDIPKTGKSDERREISLVEYTLFDESLLIPLCSSFFSFTWTLFPLLLSWLQCLSWMSYPVSDERAVTFMHLYDQHNDHD